jgi:competence protein ComEC
MTLRVLIHDVGHGQAVHIFTPNGKAIVIDLGCRANFSPLTWLKNDRGPIIDSLIVTHPHGDHIDEILLLKDLGFTIGQFWRPKWLDNGKVYEQNQSNYGEKLDAYYQLSDSYTRSISKGENIHDPIVNGGVSINVFASQDCGQSNINNHSGVVSIEYEDSTIMIPGDNEPASWRSLLNQPNFVTALKKTDIFMASHHGRESGYCAEIFETKPWLCAISNGRVQDTDAAARYSAHALGWTVNRRNGLTSQRNCITTRSDGYIDIKVGINSNGGQAYLDVSIG